MPRSTRPAPDPASLPPPELPAPPAPPRFELLRAREGRRLGGVAAGLARMTDLDPTLVRLAIAAGALTGVGALAYVIAWIVVPEEDPAAGRVITPAPPQVARGMRIGLAVLGAFGAARLLGGLWLPFGWWDGPFGWHGPGIGGLLGLTLIAGGLAVLLRRHPWTAMPTTTAPPPGTPPRSAAVAGGVSDAPPTMPPTVPMPIGPWDAPTPVTPGPPRDVALTVGRVVGWLAVLWFGASMAAATVLWAIGALRVHLPGLLCVVAAGAFVALLAALVRAKRASTVFAAVAGLAIPLVLGLGLARWDGGVGSRAVAPAVAGEIPARYEHAVGKLDIDLSDTEFPPGTTRVVARIDAGELQVTVPWDATVNVRSESQAGELDVLGRVDSGFGLTQRVRDAGEPGAATLELDLHAELGRVYVVRSFEPDTKIALEQGTDVTLQCAPGETIASRTCTSRDGYPTPELDCIVEPDSGYALCRPVGRSSPAMQELQSHGGAQHCRVPANGGLATCDAPTAEETPPAETPPPPATPAPTIQLTCETDPNGQPINCQPVG